MTAINSNQKIRSQLAKIYFDGLKKIKQVSLLFTETVEQSNFLELPITCEMRDDLFAYLLGHNIDVRKFYYRNLAEVDDYRKFGNRCPNASHIEKQILTLPCYPGFKKENAERIVKKINDFYCFQSQHKDL